VEVSEVKDSVKWSWVVVINDTFSMKLVVLPVSLVGYTAIGIVENAKSIHFVVLPLSIVIAALFVIELAPAISFAISLIALILGSYFVLFDNELALFVGVVILSYFSYGCIIIVSLRERGRCFLIYFFNL
jgi:hypothetical protein